jgi:HSP20 family protein
MNDYGSRGENERGSIEPRRSRQGIGSLWDWEPFRGFFPNNWQQMVGIDVNRRDDNYEIEMPIPGFKPEDIDIRYQDGIITVTGRNERRSFTRSLTVPDDVDEESIDANVEHGMLMITLKQHPKRQPRRINIGTKAQTAVGSGQTTTGTTDAVQSQSKSKTAT